MVESLEGTKLWGEGEHRCSLSAQPTTRQALGCTMGLESFPGTALRGKWPWASYLAPWASVASSEIGDSPSRVVVRTK